ncbi:flagellar motor switch protein FliN [Vibrio quintilis]|nr:flagellar motor switch protein FliN [Vibrio quintilis]
MSDNAEKTTIDGEDINFDDFQLEDFDTAATSAEPVQQHAGHDLNFFKNIPVTVTLEVASKELSLGDLMKAGEGSVIELDKMNGEPLDVKVNGSLLGHAEVVVVNDKYGLRLIDVIDTALSSVEA